MRRNKLNKLTGPLNKHQGIKETRPCEEIQVLLSYRPTLNPFQKNQKKLCPPKNDFWACKNDNTDYALDHLGITSVIVIGDLSSWLV